MNNWPLLLPAAAFALLAVVFAMLIRRAYAMLTERDEQLIFTRNAVDKMAAERDEVQAQYNQLAEANGNLYAQNEDLREALQEARTEVKALQLATIPMQEVAPEPVKRSTRKKAGAGE